MRQVLTALLVAAVGTMSMAGAAHAQTVTGDTIQYHMPDEPETTHKIVLSCSGDVTIYRLDLYVPRNDHTDKYGIDEHSILLNGESVTHEAQDSGTGHMWLSVVNSEVGILKQPLDLPASGSLAIPITMLDDAAGLPAKAEAHILYGSQQQTSCFLNGFAGGDISVGVLSPTAGATTGYEAETMEATLVGVEHFNRFLTDIGENWRLDPIPLDTAGGLPDAVSGLFMNGTTMMLGPPISGTLAGVMDYVNDNGIVLISCCANAHTLSAPDNVFRSLPDTRSVGTALAEYMIQDGRTVLLPVWQSNLWSDDYVEAVSERFVQLGGEVAEGISYAFGDDATQVTADMDGVVGSLADEHGAGSVAVFAIPGNSNLLFEAPAHDALGRVGWYGTFNTVGEDAFVEDESLAAFLKRTGFVALQVETGVGPSHDASRQEIAERSADGLQRYVDRLYVEAISIEITERSDRTVNANTLAAYDSAWLLGLSILRTQSTDTASIVDAMHGVGSEYYGALGMHSLDENGDLTTDAYEVWTVRDRHWTMTGLHYPMP